MKCLGVKKMKYSIVMLLSFICFHLLPTFSYAQDIYTWEISGTHTWTVPQTGNFKIEVWGGIGGSGGNSVYGYRHKAGDYFSKTSSGVEGSTGCWY